MEPEVVTLQSFPPLLYNSHLFLLLPYCLYFQSCRKEKEKQKGWIWIIATKLDWLKGSGLGWHWELWNTGLRTISIQKIYWEATGLYIPCSSISISRNHLNNFKNNHHGTCDGRSFQPTWAHLNLCAFPRAKTCLIHSSPEPVAKIFSAFILSPPSPVPPYGLFCEND